MLTTCTQSVNSPVSLYGAGAVNIYGTGAVKCFPAAKRSPESNLLDRPCQPQTCEPTGLHAPTLNPQP